MKTSVFGDRAILIEWSDQASPSLLNLIRSVEKLIKKRFRGQIIDSVISYQSLTIFPDLQVCQLNEWVKKINELESPQLSENRSVGKKWSIPVCYDKVFGLDLEEMSLTLKMSPEDLIDIHSNVPYLVYFIGFLPGFPYLEGLDSRLHYPRKSTPRPKIEKGAVAIGGAQTGIYPMSSPAGWNLIGKTPIDFFNIKESNPSFLSIGDYLKMYPIDLDQYYEIENLVSKGEYQPYFE